MRLYQYVARYETTGSIPVGTTNILQLHRAAALLRLAMTLVARSSSALEDYERLPVGEQVARGLHSTGLNSQAPERVVRYSCAQQHAARSKGLPRGGAWLKADAFIG
jgi:cytochrome c5